MAKRRLSFAHILVVLAPLASSYVAWSSSAFAAEVTKATGVPIPGQLSSLFRINDAHPEATVPTAEARDGNPLEYAYYIQDLLAKAEAAAKRQDQPAVIRYYRAVSISVPESAQGWSLLCEAYEKVNDRQRAIGACKYAIEREGAQLKDHERFVRLVAGKEGDLSPDEQTALDDVLAHLDQQPGMAVPTAHFRCEAAVKSKDRAALEKCTAVLSKAAPNDPKTIVFQWSLAMLRGQRGEAARLVDRAQVAGVSAEGIARMTTVTGRGWWRSPRALATAAFLTAALLALGLLRRRLVPARRLDGDVAAPPLPRA